jgi:hypothetical protein
MGGADSSLLCMLDNSFAEIQFKFVTNEQDKIADETDDLGAETDQFCIVCSWYPTP